MLEKMVKVEDKLLNKSLENMSKLENKIQILMNDGIIIDGQIKNKQGINKYLKKWTKLRTNGCTNVWHDGQIHFNINFPEI